MTHEKAVMAYLDAQDGGYAAIVEEGKNREYIEDGVPLKSGEDIKKAALDLVNAAREAYEDDNVRNDVVKTFLRMAGYEIDDDGNLIPPSEDGEKAEPEKKEEEEKPKRQTRRKSADKKDDKKKEPEAPAEKADEKESYFGLPIPKDWEGDFPEMPTDVTALSNGDVRKLYSQFGFLFGRCVWRLGMERAHLAQAKRTAEAKFREAMNALPAADEEGKKLTVEDKKSLAAQDPDYQTWEERMSRHEESVMKMQALRDVFSGNVDRLSREWSMRTDEFNQSHTGGGES